MDNHYDFRVNIETNSETGEVLAVYFQLRKGKSVTVKEYAEGNVFADYDRAGRLLGIEVLAPCEARVLERIAQNLPAKRFVRSSVPVGMLLSA